MLLLKKLQVGDLVATQVANDVLPPEKVGELADVLLELLYAGDDLLSLVIELGRGLVQTFEFGLEVSDEVGHVCGLEELVLGLGDGADLVVGGIFGDLAGLEVEERKDKMAVEMLYEVGEEVVVRRGGGGGRGGHDCNWNLRPACVCICACVRIRTSGM